MVVSRGVSIRLVDAVTKKPFKEHVGPDGKFYTEVEPDAQYFLEMKNVDFSDRFVLDAYVDGKRVPTHVHLAYKDHYFLGINEKSADGSKKKTAFCFRSPNFDATASATGATAGSGTSTMMMGTVKVEISEAVPRGSRPRREYSEDVFVSTKELPVVGSATLASNTTSTKEKESTIQGSTLGSNSNTNENASVKREVSTKTETTPPTPLTTVVGSAELEPTNANPVSIPVTKKQKKKVLRTIQGSFSEGSSDRPKVPVVEKQVTVGIHRKFAHKSVHRKMPVKSAPRNFYRPPRFQAGDVLDEVTIHYCTALGLIHANVLAKPPLWDQHQMNHGIINGGTVANSAVSAVPCEKIMVDAVFQGETMISAAKEFDFFDLSASP